jgi:NitT/TauT family transport system substrate-binding protein
MSISPRRSRRAFVAGVAAGVSTAALWPAIARAQASTVHVGVIHIMSDAPFYVADKKGYWKDEGIQVQFQTFESSNDMVVPFAQGGLDAGGGTPAAGLYNGVARGLTSRLVADRGTDAPGYGFDVLLVRSDLYKSGKIKSPKDLKGAIIAGNEPGSGSSAGLYFLLQKYGMGWADVHRQGLAFPLHVEALANGKVDAAYTSEPYATIAVKNGSAVKLLGDDGWYPDQQLSALLYSGTFIKNADVAFKFMRGYVRAARFYYGALKGGGFNGPNGAEVIAMLNAEMPQSDPTIYRQATPPFLNPDAKLSLASMKRDLDYFRAQGLIESDTVGVNDVIDLSFLTRALKELGPYTGPHTA